MINKKPITELERLKCGFNYEGRNKVLEKMKRTQFDYSLRLLGFKLLCLLVLKEKKLIPNNNWSKLRYLLYLQMF